MSHLDEGLLHALLDGEIGSTELPPIQAHLATCAECRARLEEERRWFAEADELVGVLELPAGGGTPAVHQARSPRVSWRGLAWAASLFAALGLGYVARGSQALPATPSPATSPADVSVAAPSATAENLRDRAPAPAERGSARDESARQPAPRGGPPPAVRSERKEEIAAKATVQTESAVVPAEPPSAPSAASSAAAGGAIQTQGLRAREEAIRLDRFNAAPALESKVAPGALAAPEPISFPDALRRLGGSLRLIEGLVPLRLEAQGPSVRVVYGVAQGELILSQELSGGRLVYRLIAPPQFPADSLARLRARVRE
jgi:hypothetical protein